jgi:hypothetical protein
LSWSWPPVLRGLVVSWGKGNPPVWFYRQSQLLRGLLLDKEQLWRRGDEPHSGTVALSARLQLVVEGHSGPCVVVDKLFSVPPNYAVTPEAQTGSSDNGIQYRYKK